MIPALRWLFHLAAVRPFVRIVLGLAVRHRDRLPAPGPALVIANHNNHLDTLVLMSLFPMRRLLRLRAAAAADYFLSNRLLAWFAINMCGIIPIKRDGFLRRDGDPIAECSAALDRGETVIIYPEGTRGEPERMAGFKPGIAHLARRHPDVPVVPVFLHGLGKFLPRGAFVPVPFLCHALVGEPVYWAGDREKFVDGLHGALARLAAEGGFADWVQCDTNGR